MKRKFIKILPIAVAVLFATSCSKEDVDNTVKTPQEIVQENVDNTINDNVETPQEIVQENVDNTINDNGESPQEIVQENDDNTVKTITITGKVSQESLSKVSLVDEVNDKTLQFDGGETFEFNDEEKKVWGHIKITDASGNYTATLYYKGKWDNLVGEDAVFTASKGSNPESLSDAYDNLNEAVQNAYYTITFRVKKVNNTVASTGYTYQMYTSEEKENLVVNIASAFIKAEVSRTITLSLGDDLDERPDVLAGYYYVLSTSVKMGRSSKDIVAGKIYKVTE